MDSWKFSALFPNHKRESKKNKPNPERLDRNVMFLLLLKVGLAKEPNIRLNDVNNLPSRPAIKIINSCTDTLFKQDQRRGD